MTYEETIKRLEELGYKVTDSFTVTSKGRVSTLKLCFEDDVRLTHICVTHYAFSAHTYVDGKAMHLIILGKEETRLILGLMEHLERINKEKGVI